MHGLADGIERGVDMPRQSNITRFAALGDTFAHTSTGSFTNGFMPNT
jgi:hypothetical protein